MPIIEPVRSQSFTVKSDGLVRRLLTKETGICEAYKIDNPPVILPETMRFNALWDTGATTTVISVRAAQQLGLSPSGDVEVVHAGGTSFSKKYLVNVQLPNKVTVIGIEVVEAPLSGFDVLVGMDIITLGDFSLTNKDGKSCFSFRMPSLACVDYVENQ